MILFRQRFNKVQGFSDLEVVLYIHGQGTNVPFSSEVMMHRGEGPSLQERVRDLRRQVVGRGRHDVVQHSHPALPLRLLLRGALAEDLAVEKKKKGIVRKA